jgi:hypothetical protein
MHRRIAHASVALALALVFAVLTPAEAQSSRAGSGTWAVVPSPNVSSGENTLLGVTALSPRDAWAVGSFADAASGQPPHTLTQHWDGRAWVTVPSPNVVGFDRLSAVDAISSRNVWAVGDFLANPNSEGGARTLTLHWNGSAWEIVPSPNAGIDGGNGRLDGVFARTPNDVWAVGSYFPDVEFPTLQPLIERWDGDRWQVVPGPSRSPGPWSELRAVSGTSPTDVWAVGVRDARVGQAFAERALILHWEGQAWKRVRVPLPASRLTPFALRDVVALSRTDAWAVGVVASNAATRTLVLHWDGDAWERVRSANPSVQFQDLAGVSAGSPSRVWTVGTYYDAGVGRLRTLVERWNGQRFLKVPSGNRGESDLNDVSAVRGARFAVGACCGVQERTLVLTPDVPR